MKYKIAQAVGLNTDQKAAQVISLMRDENNVFIGVLQLSCDDAFTTGRQMLSELADFYFEAEGSVPDRINSTFAEAEKRLSEKGDFDLLLAVISGKTLYLIASGEVSVQLKRAGKITPLLSVGSEKQLISGFLQDGDRVFLSTESLRNFLGEDLGKTLELPLEEWEDEMSAKVGMGELDDRGLAGLLIDSYEEQEAIPTLAGSQDESADLRSDSPREGASIIAKLTSLPAVLFSKLKREKEEGTLEYRPGGRFNLNKLFPKSGRGRLILAVIIVLIIGLGAGLQYKTTQDKQRNEQFTLALQAARDDFSAAQGLQSLNPVDAKNKLDSAKSNLDKALALKPSDQEGLELKKQIDAQSGSILQQYSAANFPLFLDMGLVKSGFVGKWMSLSGNNLLLLDPENKTLVVVNIEKKNNQVLAGKEQLGDAQVVSLNGGIAFVYSKDKGLLRVDTPNQKVTTVSKSDKEWGNILDVAGFASNVYLLDTTSNQIWKYIATSSGYSDKREYLNSGVKADFSGAIRMQIESSIYVLKQGGDMLRFTRGAPDNFSYEGLDKGVKEPKSFFVSSDTDNLYLLDSGNSRILVLTKTGAYKGQYQGEKFATASDLVVDEKGKKVYLLEGSKIYSLDLK